MTAGEHTIPFISPKFQNLAVIPSKKSGVSAGQTALSMINVKIHIVTCLERYGMVQKNQYPE